MENQKSIELIKEIDSLKTKYRSLLFAFTLESNRSEKHNIYKRINTVKRQLRRKTGNPIYL